MTTKILLMGHKQISTGLLEFLLTQADIEIVDVLTNSHLQGSLMTVTVKKLGLPLYIFDTVLETVKEDRLRYDLGLSVLYWRKLRDEFLTVPCLGTVSFHPALLPEYKSTGGYNLAIMGELPEWGSTAHYVNASIDTGEIIETGRSPISSSVEAAQPLECKTMQALEPFAQHIIARTVETQAKLPTTPDIGGRCVSRDEIEAMERIRDGDDVGKKIHAFWFPSYDDVYVGVDGQEYTLINHQLLEGVIPKDSTNLFAGKANT